MRLGAWRGSVDMTLQVDRNRRDFAKTSAQLRRRFGTADGA
jgi:hypothetical protein